MNISKGYFHTQCCNKRWNFEREISKKPSMLRTSTHKNAVLFFKEYVLPSTLYPLPPSMTPLVASGKSLTFAALFDLRTESEYFAAKVVTHSSFIHHTLSSKKFMSAKNGR